MTTANLHHDTDDEEVSILADDARQGLPVVPASLSITPQDEERLNRLLPPVHQVVVPVRRRAHTVDVECGRVVASPGGGPSSTNGSSDDTDECSLSSLEGDFGEPEQATTTARSSRRLSLSPEGRQRRRRQKLMSSRCMRGFIALCVYGILVLQPSTTTLMETAVPLALQHQDARFNSTKPRMADLPKFPPHHRPVFHSTMPPNAVNSITRTNGTTVHWHKVPPDPPRIAYHKKQRPILSHAHSYRLHQEPLVFGREQKTSFLLEDASEDSDDQAWMNTLVWLSLIGLLIDTSYREWQQYRWDITHRQSGPTLSALQRRQRRSLHYRRSPSPPPRRRRFLST